MNSALSIHNLCINDKSSQEVALMIYHGKIVKLYMKYKKFRQNAVV